MIAAAARQAPSPPCSGLAKNVQTGCSPHSVHARRAPARASGKGFGPSSKTPTGQEEAQTPAAAPEAGTSKSAPRASASRADVFATCASVSALVAVAGAGLRQVAPLVSTAAGGADADAMHQLLNWAVLPSPQALAVGAGAAAIISAARAALLAAWPAFREESEASNAAALGALSYADLAWVAGLPALSEELLFRGALLPAIYPDWRGALISGAVFGALHIGGGRSAPFAAWASAVGCVYGGAALLSGTVWAPVVGHALANAAAGGIWMAQRDVQRSG